MQNEVFYIQNAKRTNKEDYLECSITKSCLTLCGPMDCSPPGSSVHEIPRQGYWSGYPFPTLGNLPNPRIKFVSLASPVLAGRFFTTSATWEAPLYFLAPFYNFYTFTDNLDMIYYSLTFPLKPFV